MDAGILDGDLLVVDRAAKPVNGSVVAVNGAYTVACVCFSAISRHRNLADTERFA
ncbi:LexA family protein [Granulicella sp. S190]|uniref:LexA family protein n=1 Tax=Granulicella sp. S190 TaxID=1747226 RepID=UPI00352AB54C